MIYNSSQTHVLVKKDPIVFPKNISGVDFSKVIKGEGEGVGELDISAIYSKL